MSRLSNRAPVWALFFCLLLLPGSLPRAEAPAEAVASAHPLATAAGLDLLAAGGNAFDAAVAVSAALAVVEPYGSGLGGGGFWLLHRASDGRQVMIDGRERAPLAAYRDMYLDDQGQASPKLSLDGALAAAIPGAPAALVHVAEHYGRLPLARSLAPAIRLAREGFPVDGHYRRMASWRLAALQASLAASSQFLLNDQVPPEGYRLRQPALAQTLVALAERGREGFYGGEVAQRLVDAVREAGGIWSLRDLGEYRVVEREPVRGRYRELRIVSAAPPSSGGLVLIEMLNILSGFELRELSLVERTHLLVEAMRRGYRDRAEYLGDPDYADIPVERLLHPMYGAGLARDIRLDRASTSLAKAPEPCATEGRDTSHFSILDREGNRVAATLSINYPFGSGLVAEGTGVLLNDEMDDFSARPGSPNVYGLVGGEANAIAPGKRMLSSMAPTFVESDDGVAILGTPGGSRIITMVLQAVLALAEGQRPETWVGAPRIHHQYLPDVVQLEPGALGESERQALVAMGHKLEPLEDRYGNMQVVYWNRRSGRVSAVSDPRGIGSAVVRQVSALQPGS